MRRICAVVAFASLFLPLAVADARPARLPEFVGDCQHASVRPAEVILACGDGNAAFEVAAWTSWTARAARATGSAQINDCEPSCVAGHFHAHRAVLLLDRPRACHGASRFTRLKLIFAVRPARGQPSPVPYPCR